jgi:ABC-type phosphate transport system substrate-binding protein
VRRFLYTLGLAVWLGCGLAAGDAQAEIVVVGNPNLPVSALDPATCKRIWLGQQKHIDSGITIRPVDQAVSTPARDEFYLKLLDKAPPQVKAYWARITFTGKGEAPHTLKDDAAVKAWIGSHPDAIGYIDAAKVDNTVKVLLRLK